MNCSGCIDLTASGITLALMDQRNAEHDQPDMEVLYTLQMLRILWECDSNQICDRVLLCDLFHTLSAEKLPLRYHSARRLELVDHILANYTMPSEYFEKMEAVRHKIEKILIEVLLFTVFR